MRQRTSLCFGAVATALLLATVAAAPPEDPWTPTQVITPEQLAKELSRPNKPIIVSVVFQKLYENAHVPGSVYFGAGRDPKAIAGLKDWAKSVPKTANVVIYCGCCPWNQCPNVRPAFQALKEMGFTRLRVVEMPNDFGKDWVEKGFPIEKGQ
jgi:thiosulfate/3-mercaptopyruvate sulfurtransferase